MSKSINQVILMGNLTRDPELRTTPGGQSVCSFGMAINRTWQDQGGQAQEAVDFFDITAWGKLGELVNQYLSKGRKCLVQGRLSYRAWEKDGQKHSKVEVIASDVTFLDGGGAGAGDSGSAQSAPRRNAPAKTNDAPVEDIDDKPIDLSEIPF
ncbi:MAG TPA: single-stranded DNA-binding protein [Candidatus Saccharimonas sp.]|nr:single-stranded DNA-binding protein [Candidatus Saccharimonas sp.]